MATELRHITRIEDTEANAWANLDHGQTQVLTAAGVANARTEFHTWMNDDATLLYYPAVSKVRNITGAFFEYQDVEFNNVTAVTDVFTGEYLFHNSDTDTFVRLRDDRITLEAGGAAMIDMIEDGTQDIVEVNSSELDIDFIVNASGVSEALKVDAGTGAVTVNGVAVGTILGSGTFGYIPAFSATNTIANSGLFQTGGNLGWQNITPKSLLSFTWGTNSIDAIHLGDGTRNTRVSIDGGSCALDLVAHDALANQRWFTLTHGSAGFKIQLLTDAAGSAIDNIMTIDPSNGYIGIGTASAQTELDLRGTLYQLEDISGSDFEVSRSLVFGDESEYATRNYYFGKGTDAAQSGFVNPGDGGKILYTDKWHVYDDGSMNDIGKMEIELVEETCHFAMDFVWSGTTSGGVLPYAELLRVGYDSGIVFGRPLRLIASDGIDYADLTVDASGDLTIAPTGSNLIVNGNLSATGDTSLGGNLTLSYDANNSTAITVGQYGALTIATTSLLALGEIDIVPTAGRAVRVLSPSLSDGGFFGVGRSCAQGDIDSSENLGTIMFGINSVDGLMITGAKIRGVAAADWASNDHKARLEFLTNPLNSPDLVRLTIDENGHTIVHNDLKFSGSGSGLIAGELYSKANSNSLTCTVQNTLYKFVEFFNATGIANGVTEDLTNDRLTVATAGWYKVDASISFSGTLSSTFEVVAQKYDGASTWTELHNIHCERKLGTGGDVGSASFGGHVYLTAGQSIEMWVRCTDGAGKIFVGRDVTMSITMVGG